MRLMIALAALAAAPLAAAPLAAQAADYSIAVPAPGTWTYAPAAGGSSATFASSPGQRLFTIRCDRPRRIVSLSRLAGGAAPSMALWSSSMNRAVATGYDPATRLLTGQLAAYDKLLDALAFSRGRIAVSAASAGTLVLPTMPEFARVVEDCRV